MTSLEAYTVLNNFRIDASGEVVPGDRLGLVPVKDDKKAGAGPHRRPPF